VLLVFGRIRGLICGGDPTFGLAKSVQGIAQLIKERAVL
jgi:hypothetical protein